MFIFQPCLAQRWVFMFETSLVWKLWPVIIPPPSLLVCVLSLLRSYPIGLSASLVQSPAADRAVITSCSEL